MTRIERLLSFYPKHVYSSVRNPRSCTGGDKVLIDFGVVFV